MSSDKISSSNFTTPVNFSQNTKENQPNTLNTADVDPVLDEAMAALLDFTNDCNLGNKIEMSFTATNSHENNSISNEKTNEIGISTLKTEFNVKEEINSNDNNTINLNNSLYIKTSKTDKINSKTLKVKNFYIFSSDGTHAKIADHLEQLKTNNSNLAVLVGNKLYFHESRNITPNFELIDGNGNRQKIVGLKLRKVADNDFNVFLKKSIDSIQTRNESHLKINTIEKKRKEPIIKGRESKSTLEETDPILEKIIKKKEDEKEKKIIQQRIEFENMLDRIERNKRKNKENR